MEQTRILLADEHPLIIEGLQHVLAEDYEVVGAAADGESLLRMTFDLKPDLILSEVSLPLVDGIEASRVIRRSALATKLIFLTRKATQAGVQAALDAGGAGFILKSAARAEILKAIAHVLGGEIYVTATLGHSPVCGSARGANITGMVKPKLTVRERQTLQLIAAGQSSKEAAFVLKVTHKTISFHRHNIKRKLGLDSTATLTRYAVQEGLI